MITSLNDKIVDDEQDGNKEIVCLVTEQLTEMQQIPIHIGVSVATNEYLKQAKKHLHGVNYRYLEDHRRDPRMIYEGFGTRSSPDHWLNSDLLEHCQRLLAVHFPGSPNLLGGFRLRRPEYPIFPITSMIHSICYHDDINQVMLNLLLGRSLSCDAIVCTSHSARDSLSTQIESYQEFLAEKGIHRTSNIQLPVIPLGVDCDIFRPRDKRECRIDLDLPLDKRIVLWTGRLRFFDKADLLPLLEIIARLVRQSEYADLLFLFVGSDAAGFGSQILIPRAKEMGISDFIRLIPSPTPLALRNYYGAADIFWSPVDNPQESFGLTPLEAMASGLPVIVSDWNGYRDTVPHERAGLRAPTYWSQCCDDISLEGPLTSIFRSMHIVGQSVAIDLEILEAHLKRLLDSPEDRMRFGEQGRKHVLAHFSWSVIFRQYLDLWRELKRQASAISSIEEPIDGLDRYPWNRYFNHYATCLLTDQDRLTLTDAGIERLLNEDAPPLSTGIPDHYRPDVLQLAINALTEDEEGEGISIADLVLVLQKEYDLTDDAARRHLMWLIKYGLCKRAGAPIELA